MISFGNLVETSVEQLESTEAQGQKRSPTDHKAASIQNDPPALMSTLEMHFGCPMDKKVLFLCVLLMSRSMAVAFARWRAWAATSTAGYGQMHGLSHPKRIEPRHQLYKNMLVALEVDVIFPEVDATARQNTPW